MRMINGNFYIKKGYV